MPLDFRRTVIVNLLFHACKYNLSSSFSAPFFISHVFVHALSHNGTYALLGIHSTVIDFYPDANSEPIKLEINPILRPGLVAGHCVDHGDDLPQSSTPRRIGQD